MEGALGIERMNDPVEEVPGKFPWPIKLLIKVALCARNPVRYKDFNLVLQDEAAFYRGVPGHWNMINEVNKSVKSRHL